MMIFYFFLSFCLQARYLSTTNHRRNIPASAYHDDCSSYIAIAMYIYGSTRIFGEISVADFFGPGWNFFLKLGRKLPYRTLNNGTENYINPFIQTENMADRKCPTFLLLLALL